MSKAAMNLQDSFLNQVRRENSEVRVLLVNGTLLRGSVKGFDNFTLILNNRNGQHLIYKHAVAQIVTYRPYVKTEAVEGEEPATSAPEHHEGPSEDKAPASDKPSRPHHAPKGERQQHRPKPKKEGFNTLDLSSVKLEDAKKQ